MTITEFLLARIEEDEREAEMAGDHNGRGMFARDNYGCLLIQPSRVLAECAAKRAIIAEATGWEHELDPSAWYACRAYKLKEDSWKVLKVSEGKCNCGVTARRNAILKPLAAVYASHPDYRQEWDL